MTQTVTNRWNKYKYQNNEITRDEMTSNSNAHNTQDIDTHMYNTTECIDKRWGGHRKRITENKSETNSSMNPKKFPLVKFP